MTRCTWTNSSFQYMCILLPKLADEHNVTTSKWVEVFKSVMASVGVSGDEGGRFTKHRINCYPCFILAELVCHWTLFVFNQWNYRTCSVTEVVVFFLSVLMVRVQSLVNTLISRQVDSTQKELFSTHFLHLGLYQMKHFQPFLVLSKAIS